MLPQTDTNLKRTPLYEDHKVLKARMVPFGGWEMPVQYEGILAEYEQTRTKASVFDVSHMGEFIIDGDARTTGLDRLVTMPIVDMPLKTSRYGMLLNEQGGTIDDLIVFRIEEQKWFIVVNGATTDKDREHVKKHLSANAIFKDESLHIGKVDLQGPESRDVLMQFVPEVKNLEYFKFDYFTLLGEKALISRTGYTGELGYEIFYPWHKTSMLWQKLLKDPRVKPAGLGARDVLRLEVGYSLYGHELNDQKTPLEAGLGKFVDLTKDFIGKEALLKQKEVGPKQKLIGFTSDSRRAPREHHKVYDQNQKTIGEVTSGTFSPSLQKGIGLAYIQSNAAQKGEKIYFGDDKNKIEAMITDKVFFKRGSVKN